MAFPREAPNVGNLFLDDDLLQSYLKRFYSEQDYTDISKDLTRFGKRTIKELPALADAAEKHPPKIVKGTVVVHPAWKKLNAISAEEGIVAIGYERKYGPYSRLFQHVKTYLFHPVSAYYTCPLAMTDGAAKLIEVYGDEGLKNKAYKNLTSRDIKKFWTSGQWMTERSGGSDVSGSETIARFVKGEWRLYGEKFFTSAVTAQMAMTLARIEDENGKTIPGNRGISLFYIEVYSSPGKLNNIKVLKLKDKLGTRALPTAELKLNGTKAALVGKPGEGVKEISTLFNITRIDNALAAIGTARYMLALAEDYAKKRTAFGKPIKDHPLHAQTLLDMQCEFHAAFHLTFFVSRLLGQAEHAGEKHTPLLRVMTPLTKLYTAKQNLKITSELLESFGGAGYMEDSGIPVHFRNSQTLSIWEGTTNILSLDVLRALHRESCLDPYIKDLNERLGSISLPELNEAASKTINEAQKFAENLKNILRKDGSEQERLARRVAYSMARLTIASLLLEHANVTKENAYVLTAKLWCEKNLALIQ